MNAVPIATDRPGALTAILRSRGWDAPRAEAAADGLGPLALYVTEVPAAALEALVHWNAKAGLDLLTGEGWAVVSGSRSRVSALARPWTMPEELAEVAVKIGMAIPPETPGAVVTARGPISCDRPVIVGILNLTPDSFSDGGKLASAAAAVAHAERLVADGAGLLDVGGESSRPGARIVPCDEELDRIIPVIKELAHRWPQVPLSIDTVKARVASAALDAGAWLVNDVSGFRLDPELPEVVAKAGAGVVLMHSRGAFTEMATFEHADYPEGVVVETVAELGATVARATSAGIAAERIVIDPGLGFSKTAPQNLLLLDGLAALGALGRPILVGPSRKRFLGEVTGREVHDRDRGTAAACALAWERGARFFRVHEPAEVRDALALAHSLGAR